MNKLIKIALVTVTTLSLGIAALAHADEVGASGQDGAKHCRGEDGKGRHGGPHAAQWRAKKNAVLNSLTAAELKQIGLTDEQIKQYEAAKPFTERGQLRKLATVASLDRPQMKQLHQLVRARFKAAAQPQNETQTQ